MVGSWANHFRSHFKSRLSSKDGLQQLDKKMDDLATASFSNEEYILDVSFTLDEVVCAVKMFKPGKASGPEGISAEHLKWGGDSLYLWLLGIVNAILEMEEISSSFKLGSICPVYKGGGKYPLLANNYRGITMNSIFSKVLETLILSRLESNILTRQLP